ncbi:SGNH/GDSL hydrolase family protein [Streptomyces sp. SID14478]|uniref:SGNH/GDSL hydrolase family protein n=1 Tax=Streptomyces sp. SID14478 TaxID=2706073 RepID=UPI0013DC783C|nr:SGNH/GDSL hydrolase family protein [Streptomyces sp. SID14478]NEB73645.1 SGNH/GDSL hydrolase family protein [Streptomyces sp. SID14478]
MMSQHMYGNGTVPRRRAAMKLAVLGSLVLTVGVTGTVNAAPAKHEAQRHSSYVALGDSYTSGPLIPRQVDANCARSDHNYPSITASERHVDSFTDVSCGGATTAEMWQAQGTNGPQLDAVQRDTGLVTVQIGGNDIGFGSIISTCAGLSSTDPAGNPCEQHYRTTGYDQLSLKILQTAPKVARVLRAVHAKAPHARVVVVGYPDLLPDDGTGCYPTVPFAAKDFPYLRDTGKRLNLMLRTVALVNRAEYVDTYRPTVGHDMCKAPADRWIEPLAPTSPAAPAHPNAKGMQAMAQALVNTLKRGTWHH